MQTPSNRRTARPRRHAADEGNDVMEVDGARILVPGATGELGSALARSLHSGGAVLHLAGRDETALRSLQSQLPGVWTSTFDAYALDACAALTRQAAQQMGGLDAVVTCIGVPAFGPADHTSDAVAEHLMIVNAQAPIAFLRAALPLIQPGGVLAALTGVIAGNPPAHMADYAAAKAALAAWLEAVGKEQRRRHIALIDLRLPHINTGFANRAIAGRPPQLPPGLPIAAAVEMVMDALVAASTVSGQAS
ncbi:SDR family NAD(P)-dependent oxidoreductase [Streptomyces sp. NBC_00401]|uniref:SDR family NAD(P)-dependent oxidoreductase n=1 Tax=unclassified Streptomyces TaxID=2593676 RepID=UPI002B1E3EAD|nr:SDR family NAD(P)-dependent oxidoreductase [Streptomyces sp. NBC_00401]